MHLRDKANCRMCPSDSVTKLEKNHLMSNTNSNPVTRKIAHPYFIDNSNANISFYALTWPKLNSRYNLAFEIIS